MFIYNGKTMNYIHTNIPMHSGVSSSILTHDVTSSSISIGLALIISVLIIILSLGLFVSITYMIEDKEVTVESLGIPSQIALDIAVWTGILDEPILPYVCKEPEEDEQ